MSKRKKNLPPEIMKLLTTEDGFYPALWWWSFDTFLCGLVAEAAKKLREDGHGHPGGMTEEAWSAYLTEVEGPLRVWCLDKWENGEEYKAQYLAAQEALRKFVDRMGSWWD